jgi:hypothetical protein
MTRQDDSCFGHTSHHQVLFYSYYFIDIHNGMDSNNFNLRSFYVFLRNRSIPLGPALLLPNPQNSVCLLYYLQQVE